MKKQHFLKQLKTMAYVLLPLLGGSWAGVSCSEEEAEASEYDNWQARNEVYFATLADSLRGNPSQWQHIKSYAFDDAAEVSSTNYIYAKVIEKGTGTECPAFTDSVRVIYKGRLIPSATWPEGRVFSSTVNDQFSAATGYTTKGVVGHFVEGFTTALQLMHCGDYWRIYVPYQLGYGETAQEVADVVNIPAYSVLIFDLQLVDFRPAGEALPLWSSRQGRPE
jgi:FKBP-type peptidyl-prolyl cis-trans isomerase FklB